MKFELNNVTADYANFNLLVSTITGSISAPDWIFYGANPTTSTNIDIAQAVFVKNKEETFIVEVDFRGGAYPGTSVPTVTQFTTDHPTALNIYINGTTAP
jgi:hypothetical protein